MSLGLLSVDQADMLFNADKQRRTLSSLSVYQIKQNDFFKERTVKITTFM